MKYRLYIFGVVLFFFFSCTGSRKYFKAAEKLEEKGLINEAAEYYLISLQRNPNNVDARIKLKETGDRYIKFLSSGFFRSYNLNLDEEALEYFDKSRLFKASCDYLNVRLDHYNPDLEKDYAILLERFSEKNYVIGEKLVKQKKFNEALKYLRQVQKYNPEYKKLQTYIKTSVCEPLYVNAIKNIDNKNYKLALRQLRTVLDSSSGYKDAKEIFDLYSEIETKYVFLFPSNNLQYSEINDNLFNAFSQVNFNNVNNARIIYNPLFYNSEIEFSPDLQNAIRKVTGSEYIFIYQIRNKVSEFIGPKKESYSCYRKSNPVGAVTIYLPLTYNSVVKERRFSYEFRYKLIRTNNLQSLRSESRTILKSDRVNYNEFTEIFPQKSELADYFPYNPNKTPLSQQFDPSSWRGLFNSRREVNSEKLLERQANEEVIRLFKDLLISNIR